MTVRWVLYDEATTATWTMPINPDRMGIPVKQPAVTHSVNRYGTTTIELPRRQTAFNWAGVIRSQSHYNHLVTWAEKRSVVKVTDHVGRQFRVYISEFNPTDRSPIPSAPHRWRYEMTCVLLEEL